MIYQEIDDATNKSAAAGVPVFTGIMSANPDIKLMVTDHGNLTGTVQTFLEAAGKKPGEVYAAGFDMSGNAVKRSGRLAPAGDRPAAVSARLLRRSADLSYARITASPVCRSIPAQALLTKTMSSNWPRWWQKQIR